MGSCAWWNLSEKKIIRFFVCVCVAQTNQSRKITNQACNEKPHRIKIKATEWPAFLDKVKQIFAIGYWSLPPPTSCPAWDCPQEKRCSVPCVKSFVINPQERNLANFRHLDWTSSVNSSCVLMVAEKLMDWYASGHIRKRRKLLISKESTAEKLHRKARPWKALGGANHVWHFRISRS